jgi:hypothetical protein
MLQFLPYALAALGGYKGYREAKDSGASGLGRILGAGIGAYGGYNLGQLWLQAVASIAQLWNSSTDQQTLYPVLHKQVWVEV